MPSHTPEAGASLSPGLVQQAQLRARAQGTSLLDELDPQGSGAATQQLAALLRVAVLDLRGMEAMQPAFDLLPYAEALRRECVLLRDAVAGLVLAAADPFASSSLEWVEERARVPVEPRVAGRADIAAYLARHGETLRAMDGLVSSEPAARGAGGAQDISLRSIGEDESPVVRMVHSTLYDALKAGASDIHMETGTSGIFVRYRIDGVLASVGSISGNENAEQVISRIKVMAELDIGERRVPQDGRFKVAANGRDIDIRVSIMPSIHGEDAVLRILDKERLAGELSSLRLETLGFDGDTLRTLRRLAQEPYGMLLVTGPTGSGKTTTLYAAIAEIHNGHDKIVTIEDPVEYQLPGVLQIPVNEKKGMGFARGLRSILRHDPDKIMVGEIRDGETAQIAVQAALTGHLVLTTVHANNVFDVLGRFTHMGVDPYSLVAALNGIVAQRLMRLNCTHCVQDDLPEAALLQSCGIEDATGFAFRAAPGCAHCRGTGYRGRKAVAEVLVLDDELRELIVQRESVRRIKEVAAKSGTRLLREAGLDLVRRGETSLQELQRVVR
jgi:general secretion pathway protein E